jgi:hypothetical protein
VTIGNRIPGFLQNLLEMIFSGCSALQEFGEVKYFCPCLDTGRDLMNKEPENHKDNCHGHTQQE